MPYIISSVADETKQRNKPLGRKTEKTLRSAFLLTPGTAARGGGADLRHLFLLFKGSSRPSRPYGLSADTRKRILLLRRRTPGPAGSGEKGDRGPRENTASRRRRLHSGRGQEVLPARRRRRQKRDKGHRAEPCQRQDSFGRKHHHAADNQEPHSGSPEGLQPEDKGSDSFLQDREEPFEKRDTLPLSQPDIPRRRGLRRGDGEPKLLREIRERDKHRRSLPAGGNTQKARALLPEGQSRNRPQQAENRDKDHERAGIHNRRAEGRSARVRNAGHTQAETQGGVRGAVLHRVREGLSREEGFKKGIRKGRLQDIHHARRRPQRRGLQGASQRSAEPGEKAGQGEVHTGQAQDRGESRGIQGTAAESRFGGRKDVQGSRHRRRGVGRGNFVRHRGGRKREADDQVRRRPRPVLSASAGQVPSRRKSHGGRCSQGKGFHRPAEGEGHRSASLSQGPGGASLHGHKRQHSLDGRRLRLLAVEVQPLDPGQKAAGVGVQTLSLLRRHRQGIHADQQASRRAHHNRRLGAGELRRGVHGIGFSQGIAHQFEKPLLDKAHHGHKSAVRGRLFKVFRLRVRHKTLSVAGAGKFGDFTARADFRLFGVRKRRRVQKAEVHSQNIRPQRNPDRGQHRRDVPSVRKEAQAAERGGKAQGGQRNSPFERVRGLRAGRRASRAGRRASAFGLFRASGKGVSHRRGVSASHPQGSRKLLRERRRLQEGDKPRDRVRDDRHDGGSDIAGNRNIGQLAKRQGENRGKDGNHEQLHRRVVSGVQSHDRDRSVDREGRQHASREQGSRLQGRRSRLGGVHEQGPGQVPGAHGIRGSARHKNREHPHRGDFLQDAPAQGRGDKGS